MKRLTGILAPLLLLSPLVAAAEQDQVKLFRIVSAKDEIVVGLTAAELLKLGAGPDLDNFAHGLASAGQMTVWQYAVRKDQKGELQQAPLRRIAVFRNDTLRIEPYATPLPVVAPDK